MCPRWFPIMLLFAYLHILCMLLDVVFFISDIVIFTWRNALIPSMQVIEVTKNPLLVIVPMLARIFSYGKVISSMLCLFPMLTPDIVTWGMPNPRCFGYVHYFKSLDFFVQGAMPMHCDNQDVIFLANNLTFHERTKYIEIDCHTVCHQVLSRLITS